MKHHEPEIRKRPGAAGYIRHRNGGIPCPKARKPFFDTRRVATRMRNRN